MPKVRGLLDVVGEFSGLPADLSKKEKERLARREASPYQTQTMSGSTHPDIKEFDASISNPGNDWGRGVYSSTTAADVEANYAGIGPDLTSRISAKSEEVADILMYDSESLLDEYGFTIKQYEADEAGVAEEIARKMVVGDAPEGVTYPLRINTENYAVIKGRESTVLDEPDYHDIARSELDAADYADEMEFEDALLERADELRYEDEDSLYSRIRDALKSSDVYHDEAAIDEIMGEIQDDILEGQLSVDDLDAAIRDRVQWAYDDATGEPLSAGEISSQVFKELGFEGVVDHTVYNKFGGGGQFGQAMEGMEPDTVHVVTFPGKENTIRSEYADFDPEKFWSKDITATRPEAAAGAAGVLGALDSVDDSDETLMNYVDQEMIDMGFDPEAARSMILPFAKQDSGEIEATTPQILYDMLRGATGAYEASRRRRPEQAMQGILEAIM